LARCRTSITLKDGTDLARLDTLGVGILDILWLWFGG
jgi:hypothetical protein